MKRVSRVAALSLSLSLLWGNVAFARTAPTSTARPSRRTIQAEAQKPKRSNTRYPTVSSVTLSQSYQNEEFSVRIQYPSDWELQEHNQREANLTLVMMFLSPTAKARAQLRENVNLVVEKLPTSSMTLAEYSKLGLEKEKEFFSVFTLKSQQHVLVGKFTAEQVEFTADVNGRTVAYRQVWFLKGSQAYVWTFADHPDMFAKNLATFERMMDTMRVE